jgi:F0F1-type ATP synthase membrane subunit b/b'
MIDQLAGGLMTYYAGVAIVALPGLIGVLLMGRLHRMAVSHCQRLEEEIARAEQATEQARALLSDVAATMNFSLASSAGSADGAHRETIEALQTALQEAVWGERPRPAAASQESGLPGAG